MDRHPRASRARPCGWDGRSGAMLAKRRADPFDAMREKIFASRQAPCARATRQDWDGPRYGPGRFSKRGNIFSFENLARSVALPRPPAHAGAQPGPRPRPAPQTNGAPLPDLAISPATASTPPAGFRHRTSRPAPRPPVKRSELRPEPPLLPPDACLSASGETFGKARAVPYEEPRKTWSDT